MTCYSYVFPIPVFSKSFEPNRPLELDAKEVSRATSELNVSLNTYKTSFPCKAYTALKSKNNKHEKMCPIDHIKLKAEISLKILITPSITKSRKF